MNTVVLTGFQHGDALGLEKRELARQDAKNQLAFGMEGVRARLYALQQETCDLPEVDCPLQHVYPPGLYLRTIFIPKGTVVVGKIHRHRHGNILSQGEVAVLTESGGLEQLRGPITVVSEPGTKRAVYALTDVVWTTIHLNPSDTQDLEQLEREIIAPTYQAYLEGNKS